MASELSCPDCGHDRFTATLSARIEYTYSVSGEGYIDETHETIVDGGDLGDVDTFACADCSEEFVELSEDTLCTGDRTCLGFGEHEYCAD